MKALFKRSRQACSNFLSACSSWVRYCITIALVIIMLTVWHRNVYTQLNKQYLVESAILQTLQQEQQATAGIVHNVATLTQQAPHVAHVMHEAQALTTMLLNICNQVQLRLARLCQDDRCANTTEPITLNADGSYNAIRSFFETLAQQEAALAASTFKIIPVNDQQLTMHCTLIVDTAL